MGNWRDGGITCGEKEPNLAGGEGSKRAEDEFSLSHAELDILKSCEWTGLGGSSLYGPGAPERCQV